MVATRHSTVIFNGRPLEGEGAAELASAFRISPLPGRYWYDARSGAWGYEGSGTVGVLPAGLALGPLDPGASAGNTGVFVNGRELPAHELSDLQRVAPFAPGFYWLDADGTFGVDALRGDSSPLGNLRRAAERARLGGVRRRYSSGLLRVGRRAA